MGARLWKVTGTRLVDSWPAGSDVGRTWGVDLVDTRTGRGRTARIDVASDLDGVELPAECAAAIRTRGRSAVAPYLDDDTPPWRVLVTSRGLEPVR